MCYIYVQGKLIIPDTQQSDAGYYSCSSDGLEAEYNIYLTVTGIIPHFAQSPISYKQFPKLTEAYLNFDISVSFKPQLGYGLIVYNGQNNIATADFMSLGLSEMTPEFRYNLGSGVTVLRAPAPIDLHTWHSVTISRRRRNCTMKVDNQTEVFTNSGGKYQGLDLQEDLYLGGLPSFKNVSPDVGQTSGFVGCISQLIFGQRDNNILSTAITSVGVTDCDVCTEHTCGPRATCQEANIIPGHTCVCPPGQFGPNCDMSGNLCHPETCSGRGDCFYSGARAVCTCHIGRKGETCEEIRNISTPAFSGESFVAYPAPKHVLRRLSFKIKFKPQSLRDSVLTFAGQNDDGSGDFTSLSIKEGRVEFRFDTGSGPAVIRSRSEVRLDTWHVVRVTRKLREGHLELDDEEPVSGESPGTTRGLNIKTPFYFAGWNHDKLTMSKHVGSEQGFVGCIGKISIDGKKINFVDDAVDSRDVSQCELQGPCDLTPCQNGGTCQETGDTFTCDCAPGYTGDTCGHVETRCHTQNPCHNQGLCTGNSTHYTCHCPWGSGGINCSLSMTSFKYDYLLFLKLICRCNSGRIYRIHRKQLY